MFDGITSQFYQMNDGEIIVTVEIKLQGKPMQHKILRQVQSFPYSAEDLLEEAETGFQGFPEFNPQNFGGYSYGEIWTELFEDGERSKILATVGTSVSDGVWIENIDTKTPENIVEMMKTIQSQDDD